MVTGGTLSIRYMTSGRANGEAICLRSSQTSRVGYNALQREIRGRRQQKRKASAVWRKQRKRRSSTTWPVTTNELIKNYPKNSRPTKAPMVCKRGCKGYMRDGNLGARGTESMGWWYGGGLYSGDDISLLAGRGLGLTIRPRRSRYNISKCFGVGGPTEERVSGNG